MKLMLMTMTMLLMRNVGTSSGMKVEFQSRIGRAFWNINAQGMMVRFVKYLLNATLHARTKDYMGNGAPRHEVERSRAHVNFLGDSANKTPNGECPSSV